jgi:diguanylate cyclase (GGDEF)-like protein
MWFDLDTLFFTTVYTSAVAGCLLILTWLQHRDGAALALWGTGFMLSAGGLALIALRGTLPDLWSIVLGNAALVLGYGFGWLGVRQFQGRPPVVPVAFAGAALWLVACASDTIYGSPHARVAIVVAIVVVYCLLNAWEFYRARDAESLSRWPIIVVLLLHAAVFTARIPLAGTWPMPGEGRTPLGWHVAIALEAILAGFCLAYLLGAMARERIVRKFQRDALADPLTGVPNRRAFFEQGERLLRRVLQSRRSAAVLILDLDRFKSINDRFGHQSGDEALKTFCETVTTTLRPGDLFARIGGEEFACLLPHASRYGAAQVAERIRARVAGSPIAVGSSELTITVSIGVAASEGGARELADLVAAADKALYRAKANGRDRVELAPPRLVVVDAPALAAGEETERRTTREAR